MRMSRRQGVGYKYEVQHQPAFSLAVIQLQPEQSIQAEPGNGLQCQQHRAAIADERVASSAQSKRAAGGDRVCLSHVALGAGVKSRVARARRAIYAAID